MRTCVYVPASSFCGAVSDELGDLGPRSALGVKQGDAPVLEVVRRPERRPRCPAGLGDGRSQCVRLHGREQRGGELAVVAWRQASFDRCGEFGRDLPPVGSPGLRRRSPGPDATTSGIPPGRHAPGFAPAPEPLLIYGAPLVGGRVRRVWLRRVVVVEDERIPVADLDDRDWVAAGFGAGDSDLLKGVHAPEGRRAAGCPRAPGQVTRESRPPGEVSVPEGATTTAARAAGPKPPSAFPRSSPLRPHRLSRRSWSSLRTRTVPPRRSRQAAPGARWRP